MLSTATYAWFTMSREVEVTGIKLTATTPQTIEVSLGRATTQATIDNTTWATAPKNDAADTDLWSNKAATSSVYASFGKLIPASSTDGTNLYYTTKAKENGKSVDITMLVGHSKLLELLLKQKAILLQIQKVRVTI